MRARGMADSRRTLLDQEGRHHDGDLRDQIKLGATATKDA